MSSPTPVKSCARRVLTSAVLAAAALVFVRPPSAAAQQKIPPIVERASAYVDDFVQRFTNLVAEERYVQEIVSPRKRRELLSDFLLVKPQGLPDWFQFRDVIEVDGKPVPGRDERLTKLFVDAPKNALERARQIATDGQQYSLVQVGSDMPLLAIGFLQHSYVSHFFYTTGPIAKDLGPTVRIVKFDEWERPTILRSTMANNFYVSHGRYFIDEPTGRVVRTEFDLDRRVSPQQIVTTFKFDDDLGVIVPVEMETPLGKATYGRFRRFAVQTEEKIR